MSEDQRFANSESRMGHFRVVGELGQGGMGIVMKGWDSYLERPVAVKMILPSCLTDEVARERFYREIETLSAFNHPQVVQIFTVHREETLLYYTMELLAGTGLREGMGPETGKTFDERLACAASLARVLAHIHGEGICHRDLKPENVMLVEGRGPVLIDFGIARGVQHEDGLTRAGQMVGTLAYMAPELVRGGGGGRSSDIFAFGVILYEIFTGSLPFTNPVTLKAKPPLAPSKHDSSIPTKLEELIQELMNVEPDERPRGFEDVVRRIDDLS